MGLFSIFSSKKKKELAKKDAELKNEAITTNSKITAPQKIVKTETPKITEQIKPANTTAASKSATKEKQPEKIKHEAPAKESVKSTATKASQPKPAASNKPSTAKPEAKTSSKAQPAAAAEDEASKDGSVAIESKTTRSGKFDIRRAKDGRFYFNLYAANKANIAYSQMYSSSTAAINGIKSVITNAPKAALEDNSLKNPEAKPFPKWEIYVDKAGQYRFRLYASNGNCVCHSHGYDSKSGCKGGIDSITRIANETAAIDKSYLK